MPINNPYNNRFYLGFNKDTGELVDVAGPDNGNSDNGNIAFHPESFMQLHNENIDEHTRAELKNVLNKLRVEIRRSSLPAKRLVFVDDPKHSICGGSCGGIPFRFC